LDLQSSEVHFDHHWVTRVDKHKYLITSIANNDFLFVYDFSFFKNQQTWGRNG